MRIDGTSKIDYIVGTDEADTIYGIGGADEIEGASGNDRIRGGRGNDEIDGNAGEDNIYGDAGNDFIYSSFDNGNADTDHGGKGNDYINAGYNDIVFGDTGNDTIGGGGFTATGGSGQDIFSTGNNSTSEDGVNRQLYGKSTITDFVSGEDKVYIEAWGRLGDDGIRSLNSEDAFDAFDTNGDTKIALGDDGVSINGQSIKINFLDVTAAFADGWFNEIGDDGFVWGSGEQSLTIAGVSEILHSDWHFIA